MSITTYLWEIKLYSGLLENIFDRTCTQKACMSNRNRCDSEINQNIVISGKNEMFTLTYSESHLVSKQSSVSRSQFL